MTAIAAMAVNGMVLMGCDSAAIEQNHYLTLGATPKVFEVGPLIIGYTSSFAMGHALQHRLVMPPDLPAAHELEALDRWMAVPFMDAVRAGQREAGYLKTENGREQGGQFLVGVRGQLYVVDDDFHAGRQLGPFAAVGSGVTACLAAMNMARRCKVKAHAKCIVEAALECAQDHCATVRGPFTVLEGGREA